MSHRRLIPTIVIGAALLGVAFAHGGASAEKAKHRSSADRDGGGTFRVLAVTRDFDSIDPAISYTLTSGSLLDPVCARLFNYPDRPGRAGFRLSPEVAAGFPRISSDGRTYTFTLRKGFRFSNGAPVQASAFARASTAPSARP